MTLRLAARRLRAETASAILALLLASCTSANGSNTTSSQGCDPTATGDLDGGPTDGAVDAAKAAPCPTSGNSTSSEHGW